MVKDKEVTVTRPTGGSGNRQTSPSPTALICAVCYDDLHPVGDDYLVTTLCGHVYHYSCLYQWLSSFPSCSSEINSIRGACPNCNQPVDLNTCIKLFLSTSNTNPAVAHYDEDRRVRAELEKAQEELKKVNLLYENLKRRFDAFKNGTTTTSMTRWNPIATVLPTPRFYHSGTSATTSTFTSAPSQSNPFVLTVTNSSRSSRRSIPFPLITPDFETMVVRFANDRANCSRNRNLFPGQQQQQQYPTATATATAPPNPGPATDPDQVVPVIDLTQTQESP